MKKFCQIAIRCRLLLCTIGLLFQVSGRMDSQDFIEENLLSFLQTDGDVHMYVRELEREFYSGVQPYLRCESTSGKVS